MSKRKVDEILDDEMLIYDLAHQRWSKLPPEKLLDEAAVLFNLAVFLARHAFLRK